MPPEKERRAGWQTTSEAGDWMIGRLLWAKTAEAADATATMVATAFMVAEREREKC